MNILLGTIPKLRTREGTPFLILMYQVGNLESKLRFNCDLEFCLRQTLVIFFLWDIQPHRYVGFLRRKKKVNHIFFFLFFSPAPNLGKMFLWPLQKKSQSNYVSFLDTTVTLIFKRFLFFFTFLQYFFPRHPNFKKKKRPGQKKLLYIISQVFVSENN